MIAHGILFLIYSFFGAVLEHLNYYFTNNIHKALANPIITGFPIYGIGAYLAISINELFKHQHIIIRVVLIGLVLTLFEYIIGIGVNAGSNSYVYDNSGNKLVEAWDYSNDRFNIAGVISLSHLIVWIILGYIIINIHPVLLNKVNKCIIKN